MNTISFDNDFLKRFKVSKNNADIGTPVWSNVKVGRCPFCGCLLKTTLSGTTTYCKSKKHVRPFVIQTKKLLEITL